MDLTCSFVDVVPDDVLARYELRETRMAARIVAATNPAEWMDVVEVLRHFVLTTDDLVNAGGNESGLAARLNAAFRNRGWREGRVDTRIALQLALKPYRPVGETVEQVRGTEVHNEGYLVDNVKGRLALDVEWNAKDGNLDRDVGAYRALYDAGLIDAAVMVTRTHDDLRVLSQGLAVEVGLPVDEARKRLSTSTTTNLDKLLPRMTRGDLGGCPFLAVAICPRTWQGSPSGAPAQSCPTPHVGWTQQDLISGGPA